MFDINLSFGQVSQFEVEKKEINYEFVGFTAKPLILSYPIYCPINCKLLFFIFFK